MPLLMNLTSNFIWTNQIIDIQSFLLIILAAIESTTIAIIFKEPIENGTELLILAKPISKPKIFITKFFVYIFFSFLIMLLSVITFYAGACLTKLNFDEFYTTV
jgi:ABC-2 type transport system permease protein